MGIDRRGYDDLYGDWIENNEDEMIKKGKENAKKIFKDKGRVASKHVGDADIDDNSIDDANNQSEGGA